MALDRCRSSAEGPSRDAHHLSSGGRCGNEERRGTGPQRLQDRACQTHALSHAGRRRADQHRKTVMIGQPISRVDGPVKVTGRATYAYEYWQDEAPLYGVVVTATIGRGRIQEIDVSHAQRSPGVRAVVTHQNTPAQGARDESSPAPYWRARPTLASPHIGHYGEPVALVVAATLEQAQAAANPGSRIRARNRGF